MTYMKNLKKWLRRHILLILLIIIAILVVVIVEQYYRRPTRRTHFISSYVAWINQKKAHAPLTASDIKIVRSWMTFDYINKLFNLPSDYLKSQLNIADARYPKITLSGYAKSQNVSANTFILNVENAMQNYFSNNK